MKLHIRQTVLCTTPAGNISHIWAPCSITQSVFTGVFKTFFTSFLRHSHGAVKTFFLKKRYDIFVVYILSYSLCTFSNPVRYRYQICITANIMCDLLHKLLSIVFVFVTDSSFFIMRACITCYRKYRTRHLFIKFHITAQSDPVVLLYGTVVIMCHSY